MRSFNPVLCRWEIALFLLTIIGGCNRPAAIAPPAAEKPKVESDLATTTLPPDAVRSLGIRTEPVQNLVVQDQLQLTGWIMARQGNEVTVTAPVAGYVRAATEANGALAPVAGRPVHQGQELFTLAPVLSPVEQIQLAALKRGFENELTKAQESVRVADTELKRVKDLYRQGQLRTQQDVDQAEIKLKHAEADRAAAQDKLKLFAGGAGTETAVKTLPIRVPRSGTVLTVHVSPGQYVAAAAPLVTIIDLSSPWVRVPVPEQVLPRVEVRRPVMVALRQNEPSSTKRSEDHFLEGRPVAVVPQVDPARHTADLIYELPPNPSKLLASRAVSTITGWAGTNGNFLSLSGVLQPEPQAPGLVKDQMVTVFVPLEAKRRECVVPYAAVVFDAYGGAWVYLDQSSSDAGSHLYERRRVELGPAVPEGIVIRPALASNQKIVVEGTAALFSREFHKPPAAAGEAKSEVEDDD